MFDCGQKARYRRVRTRGPGRGIERAQEGEGEGPDEGLEAVNARLYPHRFPFMTRVGRLGTAVELTHFHTASTRFEPAILRTYTA